jgi:release factor glutamine methyltransferase
VFAEDEAALIAEAAASPAERDAMVTRRAHGEPLEHVVGWAAFCGLRIAVAPGVFVPRRRTECLVRQVITGAPARPVVVDLCCGTGAVAAALAAALDVAELHAADLDPAAVACARQNLAATNALVHQGDLDKALPARLRGRVDILAANVPYVPATQLPLLPTEARHHEPRLALDGGQDGLDVARRVVKSAPGWLAQGGRLFIETTPGQAASLASAVIEAGLSAAITGCEDLDATVVIGTRR